MKIMKIMKIKIGTKNKIIKKIQKYESGVVKPSGKFWKRLFNKRIRKLNIEEFGINKGNYKKNNFIYWN